jgi:hypothetical protein
VDVDDSRHVPFPCVFPAWTLIERHSGCQLMRRARSLSVLAS